MQGYSIIETSESWNCGNLEEYTFREFPFNPEADTATIPLHVRANTIRESHPEFSGSCTATLKVKGKKTEIEMNQDPAFSQTPGTINLSVTRSVTAKVDLIR